ncbi:MAG: hypothetical protein C4K60_07760 [Ideonella sp. MAG2]|nr:MAG: hypothetical protein C4K60_07760 [Ideonella sp. MAG2]
MVHLGPRRTTAQGSFRGHVPPHSLQGLPVATPNYGYEKRQRELAKKRKKEEKAARKAAGLPPLAQDDEAGAEPAADTPPLEPPQSQ